MQMDSFGPVIVPNVVPAAGMIHDLGNLLQVIASAVSLIDRAIGEGQLVDVGPLTDAANSAIDRANALRSNMLNTAASQPTMTKCNATCLTAAINAIRNLIVVRTGPGIQLEFISDGNVPAVACNQKEFENVVLNLVANAVDSMATGGRLTIATSGECRDTDEELRAVLRVRDSGHGMSPEIVQRIFMPSFTTKPDGHGLGLAMVGEFVRRQGGSAEVDSAVGKGTTITLRLPAVPLALPRIPKSNGIS